LVIIEEVDGGSPISPSNSYLITNIAATITIEKKVTKDFLRPTRINGKLPPESSFITATQQLFP